MCLEILAIFPIIGDIDIKMYRYRKPISKFSFRQKFFVESFQRILLSFLAPDGCISKNRDFRCQGAYLGHFANGKFRQIAEISAPVEISTLHIG